MIPTLRFFGYSVGVAKAFSINAAILLGWIINRLPEEADEATELEATAADITRGTALSEKEVRTARETLGNTLIVRHDRLTHRTFWRLDNTVLRRRLGIDGPVAEKALPELPSGESGNCHRGSPSIVREESLVEEKKNPLPPRGDSVPVPVSVPVVRKARRNGSFTPASPEIRAIIQAFAGVYEARFRSRYVPNPKRDTAAALALVTAGLEPIAVAERFNAATTVRGGFWCTKCNALPILAERWNEIGAEIAQVRTSGATVAPGTSESDAAEWARSIRELPEVGA